MFGPPRGLARWVREPLLHFLVIGALLFLAFHRWGETSAGSGRIVIAPGQVDALASGFARTWQRPPTERELKALLDEHVREEIATREAMAMGLDRDDTIIRRRLRQKFEFLAEEGVDAAPPPGDAELQAWLAAHPDAFLREPRVTFRQVYLDPNRRRGTLEADSRKLLERLSMAGPQARIDALGDPLMLPQDVQDSDRGEVARLFGDAFADSLLKTPPGRWTGPVRSGYGMHLVFVRAREEGRRPALEEVRGLVLRELAAERRKQALDALYARLLERYQVVVEPRPVAAKGAGAPPPGKRETAK